MSEQIPPGAIVSARAVSKSFVSSNASKQNQSFTALQQVSLELQQGQFVSLVGPSGCGKSTLLQIIAGLVPASSGEVFVAGKILSGPNPDKIGVVFQEPLLLPWKTAAENIEFPLSLRGTPAKAMRERSSALLELVGLSDFASAYPHQLSGGMKSRVAIARGLVMEPPVLLMDEPFAALDEQTRTRMWSELLRIVDRSRASVLFVTHGLVEAIYLADTVLVMGVKPGRIIERIEVALPRPRIVDMVGSETVGRLRNRIWELIAEAVPK